jgi:hypothetical protein
MQPAKRPELTRDGTKADLPSNPGERVAPAASGSGSKKNKAKANADDAKPAKRAKPAPTAARANNLPPRGTPSLSPTILLDGTPVATPPAGWAHKRYAESAAKRQVGADVARLAGTVTLQLHVRGNEKARAKTITALRAKVEPTHKSIRGAVQNWSKVRTPIHVSLSVGTDGMHGERRGSRCVKVYRVIFRTKSSQSPSTNTFRRNPGRVQSVHQALQV